MDYKLIGDIVTISTIGFGAIMAGVWTYIAIIMAGRINRKTRDW